MTKDEIKAKLAARYTHKRELGVKPDSRGGIASEKTDVQSGLAEFWACNRLGVRCNLQIMDGGDNGVDGVYQGQTFDVKWLGLRPDGSPRQTGRIIVDLGKLRADLYIAVTGSEKRGYVMCGWCTAGDLVASVPFKAPYPDKKGRKIRYAVHTKDLRPMEALAPGVQTKGKVW
jgi:hypothetical protein